MGDVVRLAGRRHTDALAGSATLSESGPAQSSAVTAPSVKDLIASIASQSGLTSRRRHRLTLTLLRPTPSATASSDNPRSVMKSDRCMPANVHPTHNEGQAFCTPHVVPPADMGVHVVYMGKTAQKARTAAKPLRWRVTCIRKWREASGWTLEAAADRISHSPYYLETTHASLQRLEHGKQMPKIEMIEALAHLYKTDIHSLLNLDPPGR